MRRILALVLCLALCACTTTTVPSCKPGPPPEVEMTTSPALYPDGDITIQWPSTTPASPTDHWSKIDEGVSTHDSSTTMNTAGGVSGANKMDRFSLQNVPADVDIISEVQFRLVARWHEASIPEHALEVYWYTGSTGIDPGGMPTLIDLDSKAMDTWWIWPLTGWYSITGLSLTKAQGDSLQVEIIARLPEPPNKNDTVSLTALEYRVLYTPVVSAARAPHKMGIGMGFGPGLR